MTIGRTQNRFASVAKFMNRSIGLLAVAFGLAACATPLKVQTQGKPGADFIRYRTFAFLSLEAAGPGTDSQLMSRVAGPARQAVVEALEAHGLKKVDRAQADLVVHLRGQSFPKMEVTQWGYPEYVMTERGLVEMRGVQDVQQYDKRMLAVLIYDTHTKEIVWAGLGTRTTSDAIQVGRVTAALREILARFPATTPP